MNYNEFKKECIEYFSNVTLANKFETRKMLKFSRLNKSCSFMIDNKLYVLTVDVDAFEKKPFWFLTESNDKECIRSWGSSIDSVCNKLFTGRSHQ